ncbi:hypothetical protein C0992_006141 [Termitomyces sp. T32_za158]|nr:hypothetical protein C0992_006141 [Termitomyces sp. T32_za158]
MLMTSYRVLVFSLFSNVALATFPLIDFDRMGTVGLAGAFAGLDLLQNTSSSLPFDPATSTIFSRNVDGALTRLASTNIGGRILASCNLKDVIYVTGSFSSIGTTAASNVASFTPSSGSWAPLGSNGPNGEVHSVFCDTRDNKVWVGGTFSSPGSNVAVWDPKAEAWSRPPFVGLSGAQAKVLSITTNTSDSSIFFAGSFITTFPGDGTALNGTNNPNVPFSQGATPFSSSLVPIPLENAQVDGSPSTSDPQFNNIRNILCPSGADGAGNSWFAADSFTAFITVRTFSFISVNGVRLGNTFQSGHGTSGFSVTTIPDNKVQTLHYRDPVTGQTQSCSDPCPLSADSSLLYQDFLFDSTQSITGVQIKLSEFTGTAAGLHILQLLSSGAFASSVESNNDMSCFAPNPSNTTRTGDWVVKLANTHIAGTTQNVLVAEVDVGTSTANSPTFTWMPYVSASGNYDINLLVPGCTNFQDCSSRTSVKVTVFPGEGLQPIVATISQQNDDDATILLYSGPILPSSPDFVATITMTLADNPVGSGQNGKYEIVADRVQLALKSVGTSASNGSGSTSGSAQGTNSGFGFFEWPRSFTIADADATKTLPNSTLTALDVIGMDMFKGAGGSDGLSFANPSAITTVAHHPSGSIYLGGNFTLSSGPASGSANLVVFKGGVLSSLSSNGLNGPVTCLLLNGDQLFVGGGFSDTLSGSMGGKLKGIALYNIENGSWSSLGAGLNGPVNALSLANGQVLAAGNFTQVLAMSASSGGVPTTGLAAWDIKKGTWVNSGGFVVGSLTHVGNETSSMQLMAGHVTAARKIGANGMIMLKNGDSKTGPAITPLGAQLDVLPESASPIVVRRRSSINSSACMSHLLRSKLFFRQSTITQLSPLPASVPAPAPAVLAGAFWTNSSSSVEVAIIGGNFSFLVPGSSTASEAIALYNPISATIQRLQGPQLNGTVRSLLVDGNLLYIGGEFTIPGTDTNGLAIFDLSTQEWDTSVPALRGSTNLPVIVRSVSKSSSREHTIIVAGTFSQAGALHCQSVCAYDTSNRQWNILGSGIRGEVASIAYGGENQDILVASGSIALSDDTVSNVVGYSFSNNTWAALGTVEELPGPVSAIEVNNGNVSSVFAAGRSTNGSSSFLSFWNGVKWTTLGSSLQGGTIVSQLTMVPLQDTHSANGVIEPDRLLMVSGLLFDSKFGNASSALFDGRNFIPFVQTSSASGSPGAVTSLFRSFSSFSFSQRRRYCSAEVVIDFLAVGVVILISIAIAAGVVFLIALIGILWTLLSRHDDKLAKLDGGEEEDDSTHYRPSSLLEHINAATRTTILGTRPFTTEKEEKINHDNHDPFGPDTSDYIRAETPSDAIGGLLAEETSRPAHARYSFDGAGEGELPISAGAELEVLDDRDPAYVVFLISRFRHVDLYHLDGGMLEMCTQAKKV